MKDIKVLKNVVYAKTQRERLTADVYLPVGVSDVPLVIMVHGGAFQAGSKEMYADWGPYLAERGIAAMAVNYRLATPSLPSYPGLLEDMQEAINFVVDHAHSWSVEPTNIGFMGDSAGGYLGAMAACFEEMASAKIKFVISAYGVLDIIDWANYTNATRNDHVVTKMFGQDTFTGREHYLKACPMARLDHAIRSPLFQTSFMMIWGEEDDVVQPANQTLAFIKKLQTYNVPHETLSIPGYGHFWFTKNDSSDSSGGMSAILSDHVAPKVVDFIHKKVKQSYLSDPESAIL